jgi:hypothetical protein
MCFVKALVWEPKEFVSVPFPALRARNNHPNYLHLWRHKDRITEVGPIPSNFFTQKTERRIGDW